MSAAPLLILAMFAVDGPTAKTTYYLGESKVMRPDGLPLGNLVALVKREVKPAESTIVETVLMVSSRPGEPVKEYVTTLKVIGSKFTASEKSGGFEGVGELVGKPWEWTGWSSTSKLTGANGGMVKSTDTLGGRGLIIAKEVYSADGAMRVKITEDYASIDGATYELLRDKLMPKG